MPTDADASDQRLLSLWRARHNTWDIARICGLKESEVASRLPGIRERARQAEREARA